MRPVLTVEVIAELVRPVRTLGATSVREIGRIASLRDAEPGDLSFLGNPKYREDVLRCRASVLLLPPKHTGEPPAEQLWLIVDNPSAALTAICRHLERWVFPRPAPGVHPSAVVSPEASIAASASIGPLCVVDDGACVGEGTILAAGVSLGRAAIVGRDCWLMERAVVAAECVLGDRVRLQAGAIIGSDGYGYDTIEGRHEKIPQIGNVVIGDDVEIGANTTVDRARFGSTRIGEGTKIDNLVQIAHNCVIGRHCLIVAQVGLAGSTTLGDYVVVGGQAGLAGHLKIGSGAKIGGQAGVQRDLDPGAYVWGSPSIPYLLEQKFAILRPRIPELFRRVDRIEAELAELHPLRPAG
jgi:UDP-3-O-[3-hydroxymyristoyl] glucosamine N-acyltransferase